MNDTPLTDTAARFIGKLAAHYKFGNELSALDFAEAANAALDPLRELEQKLALESARLDRLDSERQYYSRPPMRAVTGWEWSIINENGAQTLREAIDEKL